MVDMVEQLLAFPDAHPYAKCGGTPLAPGRDADAGLDVPVERLTPGLAQELAWLLPALRQGRA